MGLDTLAEDAGFGAINCLKILKNIFDGADTIMDEFKGVQLYPY